MDKVKKIEIHISSKNPADYEMTVENGIKFAYYSFPSKEKLIEFLKGFQEAVKFLNLNCSIEIKGFENLRNKI